MGMRPWQIAGAIALSYSAAPAFAQEIATVGILLPKTEQIAFKSECPDLTVDATFLNQWNGPTLLSGVRFNGKLLPSDNASLIEAQSILSDIHSVYFMGAVCVSADEIRIGFTGLRRSPPPGEKEDLLGSIRLRR